MSYSFAASLLRPATCLLALAALAACQPEYHSFVGYRQAQFSVQAIRQQPVALYVIGGPAKGVAFAEEEIIDGVRPGEVVDTAAVLALLKDAKLPEVRPSAFAVMNSDYRPQPVEQALAPVVAQLRAKTAARYLIACVGWLDAGAAGSMPQLHTWEASPMAGHTGAVKVHVVEVASGHVLATTHAFVLSRDAASGKVTMESNKVDLTKSVWEDTAGLAIEKLEQAR